MYRLFKNIRPAQNCATKNCLKRYTHYKTLGIQTDSTPKQIKAAYYEKAKEMHPDKGSGNEAAMIKVNEAYGVLSDNSTKREYDATLPASRQTSKQSGGYYGSDDFYGYSPSSGQNTSHFYTYEKPDQDYDFRNQSGERAFWEDEFKNDYYSKRNDYKKDDERIRREEQAFREEYFDHHNFTPTGSYEDFEFHHEHYGDDELGEDEFGYFGETGSQQFNQAFHDHLKNQHSKSQQKTSKNSFSESAHQMYENYRREVFDKNKNPKDRSKQFSYEYEKPSKKSSRRSHQRGYTEVDNAFWFEISTLYTAYATGEVDDSETGLYIEGLIDTYELTESAKSLILDEVAERFPGFDFSRVSNYDTPRNGSFHYPEADFRTVRTGSEYVYKNMGSSFIGKTDYDKLEEHLFGPRRSGEERTNKSKSKNQNKKKKKKRKKSNDKQNNDSSKNK